MPTWVMIPVDLYSVRRRSGLQVQSLVTCSTPPWQQMQTSAMWCCSHTSVTATSLCGRKEVRSAVEPEPLPFLPTSPLSMP